MKRHKKDKEIDKDDVIVQAETTDIPVNTTTHHGMRIISMRHNTFDW